MEVAERRLTAIQPDVFRPPGSTALSHLADCIYSAAAFCEHALDEARVGESLRGPELAPSVLARSLGMTVGEVVSHRFGELRRLGLAKRKAPGRLLAYFPDAELFDGAAQAASDGLFDVHSAPAWGTWVGYFEESADSDSVYVRYLLAWISQGLVKRATIGIEVDCTASIQWVDDTSLEIKSILRHIDSANAA